MHYVQVLRDIHEIFQWGILWTRGWTSWFVNSENFFTRPQNISFSRNIFLHESIYFEISLNIRCVSFCFMSVQYKPCVIYATRISLFSTIRSSYEPLVHGIKYCLISSKRGPNFQTYSRFWNKHKLGRESRWSPKTSTTLLARTSRNLRDWIGLWCPILHWNFFLILLYI